MTGGTHQKGSPRHRWGAIAAVIACASVGCTFDDPRAVQPEGTLRFPGALARSSSGDHLYVVGTNFDLAFRGALVQSLPVAELEARLPRIAAGSAPARVVGLPLAGEVRIGSFAGLVAVVPLADGTDRLFIPIRGSGTVAVVDAAADGSLSCHVPAGAAPSADECEPLEIPLVTASGETVDDPFSVAAVGDAVYVGALADQPVDPDEPDGEQVTHLARLPVDAPEAVTVRTAERMRLRDLAASPRGRLFGAGTFVTGRSGSAQVRSWDVAGFDSGVTPEVLSLGGLLGSTDARSLVFSASGEMLYVVSRSPSALSVLEVGGATASELRLRRTIPLPTSPARLARIDGPAGDLLLVTVTGEDTLLVVDPVRGEIVGVLDGTACETAGPCPTGSRDAELRDARYDVGDRPFGMVPIADGAGGYRIWLTTFGDAELSRDESLVAGNGTLRVVDLPDPARPWELVVSGVLVAPVSEDTP